MSGSPRTSNSQTSAFTLPWKDPRCEEQEQQQSRDYHHQQQQQQQTPTNSVAYEGFSPPQQQQHTQSPSLPWLVEYWSTSFFRVPSMILDQLCACNASQSPYGYGCENEHEHNNTNHYHHHHSDSYAAAATAPRTPAAIGEYECYDRGYDGDRDNADPHSPCPLSPVNTSSNTNTNTHSHKNWSRHNHKGWDALRSVVASHDHDARPNSRRSSIVADDESGTTHGGRDDDEDQDGRIPHHDCDSYHEDASNGNSLHAAGNARVRVPASTRASCTSTSYLATTLYTCSSFDQYIDTSRFWCSSDGPVDRGAVAVDPAGSPPVGGRPRLGSTASVSMSSAAATTPPRTPARHGGFHERQRHRQAKRTAQPSKSMPAFASTSTPPRRHGRSPTPPSPSDTHTTISLSQSFAEEFDEDHATDAGTDGNGEPASPQDDELLIQPANDIGSSASASVCVGSLERDIRQGHLFLDPVAAQQLLADAGAAATATSTSTTSLSTSVTGSSIANNNTATDAPSSRRSWQLRQRTTTTVPSSKDETKSQDDGGDNDNSNQQRQESDKDHHDPFVSAAKSVFQKPLRHYPQDYSNGNGDDSAYRYLIRMSPTNYRHEESKDSICNGNDGSTTEFGCQEGPDNVNDDDDVFSTASSSVLLPLHPHQRVMAPLPHQETGGCHCDDNGNSIDVDIDIDNSGYTTMHFRDSLLIPEF